MPNEKQKIIAVLIIGLKSGERVMVDICDMRTLNIIAETSNGIEAIEDAKQYFYNKIIAILDCEMYLNGQRHIKCYWFDSSQIESISITNTGEL